MNFTSNSCGNGKSRSRYRSSGRSQSGITKHDSTQQQLLDVTHLVDHEAQFDISWNRKNRFGWLELACVIPIHTSTTLNLSSSSLKLHHRSRKGDRPLHRREERSTLAPFNTIHKSTPNLQGFQFRAGDRGDGGGLNDQFRQPPTQATANKAKRQQPNR